VAELACHVEIARMGMPIGKQDQHAAAFGGLNAIAFMRHAVSVAPVHVPSALRRALAARLLLFSTGLTRNSAEVLKRQCHDTLTDPNVIAALHRIKLLAHDMHASLLEGDLDGFGRLLDRAWQEKKRLSGGISNAEIDRWYAAARSAGALGGKIAGAGGGGFMLLYSPMHRRQSVRAAMRAHGLSELTFGFDEEGARLWPDAAADDRLWAVGWEGWQPITGFDAEARRESA
jgi:D-glycero-alpha-D-manno-heptose-7-phosphate kinase